MELIEKFDDEAKQIIESIRSLPKTKYVLNSVVLI